MSRFLDWLEIAAFAAVIRCPRAIPGTVYLFRQEVRYRRLTGPVVSVVTLVVSVVMNSHRR